MNLWCLIIKKKKRLLFESMLTIIQNWALILKIVERDIFPKNLKHQYLLSWRGECVYGGQSLNEKR